MLFALEELRRRRLAFFSYLISPFVRHASMRFIKKCQKLACKTEPLVRPFPALEFVFKTVAIEALPSSISAVVKLGTCRLKP